MVESVAPAADVVVLAVAAPVAKLGIREFEDILVVVVAVVIDQSTGKFWLYF